MSSISVSLPLTQDDSTGFGMNTTLVDTIKQNLKMLILTEPKERTMQSEYGVGMKRFLFERFSDDVYSQIDTRIREQVELYMSEVKIERINFFLLEPDSNKINFRLEYSIPSIGASDLLEFTI